MHGADLVRAIQRIDPEAEIRGMGGPLMAAAGVEILYDPTAKSTIGFIEVVKNYRLFKRLLNRFEASWQERRPDLMIWVDFGGFNLALAERAHRHGIPVLCIFSPSAWAYGRKRAVRMGGCVSKLAAVLPFEADFYRNYGVDAEYVGHPLIDRVKSETTREEFRGQRGLEPGQPLIALLPGSRWQELRRLLPIMLRATHIIAAHRPDARFVLPVAPSINDVEVDGIMQSVEHPPIELLKGNSYAAMAGADLGLIASGTATLEAAILGLPLILAYRVSSVSAVIYRSLADRKIREEGVLLALPNLILGKRIVPEFIQEACTDENLARAALDILASPQRMKEIHDSMAELQEIIGPRDVMSRVARMALHLAEE